MPFRTGSRYSFVASSQARRASLATRDPVDHASLHRPTPRASSRRHRLADARRRRGRFRTDADPARPHHAERLVNFLGPSRRAERARNGGGSRCCARRRQPHGRADLPVVALKWLRNGDGRRQQAGFEHAGRFRSLEQRDDARRLQLAQPARHRQCGGWPRVPRFGRLHRRHRFPRQGWLRRDLQVRGRQRLLEHRLQQFVAFARSLPRRAGSRRVRVSTRIDADRHAGAARRGRSIRQPAAPRPRQHGDVAWSAQLGSRRGSHGCDGNRTGRRSDPLHRVAAARPSDRAVDRSRGEVRPQPLRAGTRATGDRDGPREAGGLHAARAPSNAACSTRS